MDATRSFVNHVIVIMAFILLISLATQFARADDEDEGCGHNCQSIDPDPSQMSRCVRYACRRRVFRYFIRFGKRTGAGGDDDQQQPKDRLQSRLQNYRPYSSHQQQALKATWPESKSHTPENLLPVSSKSELGQADQLTQFEQDHVMGADTDPQQRQVPSLETELQQDGSRGRQAKLIGVLLRFQ